MKIEKKLIKELVDYLSEFNLTEIEYQEGTKKIKVSKASRGSLDTGRASAIVSPTKSVLSNNYEASKEDLRYIENKFESILFDKDYLNFFDLKKIKKFILEIS